MVDRSKDDKGPSEKVDDLIEGGKYCITETGMTTHLDAEGRLVKCGWMRVKSV